MKKNIFALIILVFSQFIFGQELPEVPIKNGMTFYEFHHKLDNKRKCLSEYFRFLSTEFQTLNNLISKSINSYNDSESKISLILISPTNQKPKCIDTITYTNQSLTLVLKNSPKPFATQGTIRIIFLSKNEYKLNIVNLSFLFDSNNENDPRGIADIYLKIKEGGKPTKKELRFFEQINYLTERIDKVILNALSETYRVDEL
jgi:hypothetical protein